MSKYTAAFTKPGERVRKIALAYPETHEDHPWGESAFKVKKKVFVFMSASDDGWHLSLKLPESADMALSMDGASPTGYGLGRAGWVSFTYTTVKSVPFDIITDFIDESYRAVAPKTLVKQLDARRA